MEEAITRLKLAARVGADVCFIEGVRDKQQLALAPTPVGFTSMLGSSISDLHLQVLCNVISGGLTPCFTSSEAEAMGAKIISKSSLLLSRALMLTTPVVFSLVSCVAMVHAVRNAMHLLKKTGTDFTSANGMDPKAFFQVMGKHA
jgi:hypothetical protein